MSGIYNSGFGGREFFLYRRTAIADFKLTTNVIQFWGNIFISCGYILKVIIERLRLLFPALIQYVYFSLFLNFPLRCLVLFFYNFFLFYKRLFSNWKVVFLRIAWLNRACSFYFQFCAVVGLCHSIPNTRSTKFIV